MSTQQSLWTAAGLSPVRPVDPAAPWIGGKRALAPDLVKLIHETAHDTYAEGFVGMGGVFFRRHFRPPAEVINDRSRDVANLFRILQRHYVAFIEMIRWQVTTRAEFERLIKVDPATQTDLERAARFLYLQRTAFGGKVEGRNFGVSPGESASFDFTKVAPILEALHDRLAGVTIEDLDYRDFITRYDRPGTLFYLDPPYAGAEHYYGKDLFGPAEFGRMAEQLANIQGRFILSINDTPAMREVFARFNLQQMDLSYTIASKEATDAKELVVIGP